MAPFVRAIAFAACAVAACGPTRRDGSTPDGAADSSAAAPLVRDAEPDASAEGGRGGTDAGPLAASPSPDPFGLARTAARAGCGGPFEAHVSGADVRTSFVDGDDLLAIVNRSPTGQLPLDYAPGDLVDLRTRKPQTAADCEKVQCLRKDAAGALGELMAEMKTRGFPGKVESAFRSYGAQCGTFLNWARKGSFCDATEQSALPGHSQHQLGTTVDLFTEEWARDERGVFREGFGCTPAGKFLQEQAWDHGFVMPYPLHPDDRHAKQKCTARWDIPVNINPRTGYRFEHWHIRYVGKDAARAFKASWQASGPGTPNELTVEQWLRAQRGIGGGDAELPVCDGCNCGACATLAAPGESVCDKRKGIAQGGALHLDGHGVPLRPLRPPAIVRVGRPARRGSHKKSNPRGAVVEVDVDVPERTTTQPPIVAPAVAGYDAEGATFDKLAPYLETTERGFPSLAGAWVVAIEPVPNALGVAWPWRAALTSPVHAQIYNRADVVLPARTGELTVRVPLPAGVARVKVVLLEGGAPRGDEKTLDLDVERERDEGSAGKMDREPAPLRPGGRSRGRP
jgi:D-alanyl-D-alanine carboxypeptidase